MVRSAVALLAVLLAGCTTSPLTGRDQFLLVSDSMAVSQSAAAYTQMMAELDKKKQIETGTPRAEKVKEITDKLVQQAVRVRPDAKSWKWEVQVINDPKTVNAFCMAGGKMAIYTGMWEKLKATDDEIAQVMGHEIAHALADHTRERMSIAMTSAVATTAAAIAIGSRDSGPGAGLALTGAQLAAVLAIQLPNSRERRSRGRPDRHRARGARRLRPEGRGDPVGKNGQGRRRRSAGIPLHPSFAAEPRGATRRARQAGRAALPRGQGRQDGRGRQADHLSAQVIR